MKPAHLAPTLLLIALGAARAVSGPAEVLAPERGPTAAQDPIEVDILRLKNIEYEPGEPLPSWVQQLDGRRILITGYMIGDANEDIDEFMIIGDTCQCGGTPLLHHFVLVTLESGSTTIRPGLQTFLGTFSAGEVEDEDGFVTSVFRLHGEFF